MQICVYENIFKDEFYVIEISQAKAKKNDI